MTQKLKVGKGGRGKCERGGGRKEDIPKNFVNKRKRKKNIKKWKNIK